MIDLRGLKIRVETREECEKLFEMARGQGFKWMNKENLYILHGQSFPDAIHFHEKREVTWCCDRYNIEAKDIFRIENKTENNEMTAKEFIHKYKRMNVCEDVPEKKCDNCIWYRKHTKCGQDLCNYFDYEIETKDEFEKELLEIIETHDSPVWIDPEKEAMKKETEEAVGILEGTIKGLKDSGINNKLTEALKVALDSLKGE